MKIKQVQLTYAKHNNKPFCLIDVTFEDGSNKKIILPQEQVHFINCYPSYDAWFKIHKTDN